MVVEVRFERNTQSKGINFHFHDLKINESETKDEGMNVKQQKQLDEGIHLTNNIISSAKE